MVKGLAFPNGVALSKDNSFLLLAESTTLKVLKVALRGRNTIQTFAEVIIPLNSKCHYFDFKI